MKKTAFHVVMILCAFSCNNKDDVLREISNYHSCITSCEDAVMQDPDWYFDNNQCMRQCTQDTVGSTDKCMGLPETIGHPPIQYYPRIDCLEKVTGSHAKCLDNCKDRLKKRNEAIAKFKKCKQACVSGAGNSN